MITLVKASALMATALTAAATVVALRMPAPGGGATAPLVVAPAASQGPGAGPPGRAGQTGGSAVGSETATGGGSSGGGTPTGGGGTPTDGSANRLPRHCGRTPRRGLVIGSGRGSP
jgi:hypothetical protein